MSPANVISPLDYSSAEEDKSKEETDRLYFLTQNKITIKSPTRPTRHMTNTIDFRTDSSMLPNIKSPKAIIRVEDASKVNLEKLTLPTEMNVSESSSEDDQSPKVKLK